MLQTYRDGSQLLECPFPPCVVDQSLLARLEFQSRMGRRRRLVDHATRQVKETRRAVKRDAAVIFHLQALKVPRQVRQAFSSVARVGLEVSRRAMGTRMGRVFRFAGPFGPYFRQGLLQLRDFGLEGFGVG